MSLALTLGTAGGAHALLKTSPPVRYANGAVLTATAGLPLISDFGGCSDYSSQANITKRPTWIKNVTSFHANGIGATVGGASLIADGAEASSTWTNNNGALGSFLSGNVCTNWLTWSVSMNVTGSAFQFGTVRTASVAF